MDKGGVRGRFVWAGGWGAGCVDTVPGLVTGGGEARCSLMGMGSHGSNQR